MLLSQVSVHYAFGNDRVDLVSTGYELEYSRANAPTGSAGEESVSWCWVVVVVVVVVVVAVARCFVGTHARRARARARQTSPQILTLLARARARAARTRTYAERIVGSPQTKPKPWYLRCFCSKRENKN